MDSFWQMAAQFADPFFIFALAAGTGWGVLIGALPGLGPILAISICLPFTYSLSPMAGMALIVGCYCGSVYGGSISAILINTPGTPQAAATTIDGFALTRKGRAGIALGWANVASVAGGLFSCVILILLGPRLAEFALNFGHIETFAMILLALTCIIGVSSENLLKGLLAGIIGLFLAGIGADPLFGELRFEYGVFELSAGVDLISMVIGLFALSEVLQRVCRPEKQEGVTFDGTTFTGMRFPTLRELWAKRKIILKSSVIGTGIGILPGTGAAVSCFISYAEAKRSSPNREQMGHGEVDGVIAPQAADNAVTGGALIPTLALGLPGDAITAIMLATLTIQGITPGVRLMVDSPDIVYGVFAALILANFLLIPWGMGISRAFARLLRIPEPLLFAGVVVLCLLGAWGARSNPFDLYIAVAAGLFGLALKLWKGPVAPMVIGLVLGNQVEINLRQGIILAQGDWVVFLTYSAIAMILFGVTALVLLFPLVRRAVRPLQARKNAVRNVDGKSQP